MRITQITINFTETCNLGDYSNTKPSVELTAILDASDHVIDVLQELVATAKSVIHEKVDEELERVGKPPKYWDRERYDVIYSHTTRFVAIVPADTIDQLDGGFYHIAEGVRYPAAQKAANRKRGQIGASDFVELFDCTLGDFVLPELYEHTTEQNRLYEQKQQERRQAEETERQRREAEREAPRRKVLAEEEDDDFEEDDDDDNE